MSKRIGYRSLSLFYWQQVLRPSKDEDEAATKAGRPT